MAKKSLPHEPKPVVKVDLEEVELECRFCGNHDTHFSLSGRCRKCWKSEPDDARLPFVWSKSTAEPVHDLWAPGQKLPTLWEYGQELTKIYSTLLSLWPEERVMQLSALAFRAAQDAVKA